MASTYSGDESGFGHWGALALMMCSWIEVLTAPPRSVNVSCEIMFYGWTFDPYETGLQVQEQSATAVSS